MSDLFRFPEQFLSNLLIKEARSETVDKSDNPEIFMRAVVVGIDVNGGKLENPNGEGALVHKINGRNVSIQANIGPSNPKNSIKARIISDGFDQFSSDADLRVFWPFFPEHMQTPIKLGEHCYVLFEGDDYQHGMWVGKVSGQEGINSAPGASFFEKDSASTLASKFPDTAAASSKQDTEETDVTAGESSVPNGSLTKLF